MSLLLRHRVLNNIEAPAPEPHLEVIYGLLYNWYAVTDARNIAADGWQVATDAQWTALRDFGGGSPAVTNKLKTEGTNYWANAYGTNDYNFNWRGAGIRQNNGPFQSLKNLSSVFSATHSYSIYNSNFTFYRYVYSSAWGARAGMSVRLTKISLTVDEENLTDGQYGPYYTGNDGKIYSTVKINGVLWLADHLCETKYRNNDSIAEVTGNAAWAALTTGALCAYNNNWANAFIIQ